MNTTSKYAALIALSALSGAARANIVSYSDQGEALASQSYQDPNRDGAPLSDSVVGGEINFGSPYAAFTNDNITTSSSCTYTSQEAVSNSTTLDVIGSYAAYGSASTGVLSGIGTSACFGSNYVQFVLDAPGTITLSARNTVTSSTGSNSTTNTLLCDGTEYLDAATDGTFTIALAAGAHSALFHGDSQAYAGNYGGTDYGDSSSSQLSADYEMKITSTPEPTTMAFAAAGVVALLRKRRSKA